MNHLRIFDTCVSANNSLCGKVVSSLEFPTKFDERFKLRQFHFLFEISIY